MKDSFLDSWIQALYLDEDSVPNAANTLVHPFLVLQCLMLQITLVHPFLVQNVTNTRNELVASIKSNCQDNQHTR